MWAEVLKVERVGRNDNFFELGGHSLLAVTLIERMRREGLPTNVRTLFTAPTLRVLAETMAGETGTEIEVPPNLIPPGCRAIRPEMLPLVRLTQSEIDIITAGVPGGAANIQDIYPLAPLQEGILFHHLVSAQGDAYLLLTLLAFETRPRLEEFIGALQAVIARHDILRTAVVWEGLSAPVQVVWREAELMIEEVTFDQVAEETEDREEVEIARQLRERYSPRRIRLNLGRAPLMRCIITRDEANERWLLLWLSHHLTIDHTTIEIMTREAQALLLGEMERLPEPLPFRNFVAQARLGVDQEEHEAFFRSMLGDIEEPTAPFGLLDARGDGSGIEEKRIELEVGLGQRIRARARALRVSAASLCHLAWAQVLARVSGREDVVFGTVLFGRMQGGEGADRTPGLFINTLPVRIRVGEQGVERSVKHIHTLLAELMRHEHASLALAQRCSGVAAPMPLFSALFNYRHGSQEADLSPGAAMAWAGISILDSEDRTNYPLALSVDDLDDGFALTVQIVSPLDPGRICNLMRTALEKLVRALETSPETETRAVDVLPEAERTQILVEWNATDAYYPQDTCVHELFEAQVRKNPDALALEHTSQSLTYGELNARANQLAHYLQELGVTPDTRVAICMDRSIEMMVAILATLKVGGASVPLDPVAPTERLAYMVKDSASVVMLTWGAVREQMAEQMPGVRIVNLGADAQQWAHHSTLNPNCTDVGLNARNLAYILYTSGSTGQPKGVMVEHHSLHNQIRLLQRRYSFDSSDRILQFAGPTFDMSLEEMFGSLLSGACLVLRTDAWLTNGDAFWQLCAAHGITFANLPTLFWQQLGQSNDSIIPPHLHTIAIGGDAVECKALSAWFARRGDLPRLFNAYGPTEATINATIDAPSPDALEVPSIGRPLDNTRIYILDSRHQPAPRGVTGEIYIGGVGVARGYLNRPELTSERFLPDLFSGKPGARMYKTGDLGRWLPDGRIEFLGRNDFQVKIRGFRIELGEIEAALSSHSEVRQAVVLVDEDPEFGKRLIAYYTGEDLGAHALRAHLLSELPLYMVPAAYIHLERLPLTPNGKLDRQTLQALPVSDGQILPSDRYEPPVGRTETQLARIWAEVLKLERVGRYDNFFELGGHSLLAMSLVSKLKQIGITVSLTDIFTYPTIQLMAAHVQFFQADSSAAIPFRTEGDEPPLFLVHEVSGEVVSGPLLVPHLAPGFPVYGLAAPGIREEPLRTMQAMATRMTQMIRAVQPDGPYRIAGWSFGGTLAYAVATQLIGEDATVEFLGNFDGYYFGPGAKILDETPADDNGLLLHLLRVDAELYQSLGASNDEDPSFEALVRACRERLLLPGDLSVEEVRCHLDRNRRYSLAMSHYLADPIPIPFHIFVAEDQGKMAAAGPFRNWEAVVPERQIELIPVPGDHMSMMKPPHVAVVGAALSEALGRARQVSIHQPEKEYCPMLSINTGSGGPTPVLCVPGAGGTATSFLGLAAGLGSLGPIEAIQPRGLEGKLVPHTTVQAAARSYLHSLREKYPGGPVHLIGHSFGGWVAFEIAHLMRDAGQAVASLTILDGDPPDSGDHDGVLGQEYSRTEAVVELINLYEQAAGRSLEIDLDRMEVLDPPGQLDLLFDRLVWAELMPRQSRATDLAGMVRTFETSLRTRYRPRNVYPDPVSLVLSCDPKKDGAANERASVGTVARWKHWAPNLTVWYGPGNHLTMLRQPHVAVVGEWLQSRLQQAK
ncbi:MAG TPA: amino acid adenylation domain-containing protein [Blastocatellia bacterium]|nr:amino acid adenylation domain-containing protein [Blastocatellia bacterium]